MNPRLRNQSRNGRPGRRVAPGAVFLAPAVLVAFLLGAIAAAPAHAAPPLRAGIFVGSDEGLFSEEDLFYANEDARKVHDTFATWGGLEPRLATLLPDADRDAVRTALDELRERIALLAAHREGGMECVFYYSGHGGTGGLHLSGETLGYDELYRRLDGLGCDLLVVVLDACQSGALLGIDALRLKGLTYSSEEFRVRVWDSRSGQVFVTSAAANEYAQEKDELRGSVFTHHLVRGLLGAADRDGDLRVTLGEAYDFASRRTAQDTFGSARGFQVPAFRFDVHGSQDVVLTTLADGRTAAPPPADVAGLLTFLDEESGVIWGDFRAGADADRITVPAGRYRVRLSRPDGSLALSECRVAKDGATRWGPFEAIAADDDPLKGRRTRHHVSLRLLGGAAFSPDGTAAPTLGWGGGVAVTVDNVGLPPLYLGLSVQARTGATTDEVFDLSIERRTTTILAHALVGWQHRFAGFLDLAGELRLGGGYAVVTRDLPGGRRTTGSAVLDTGAGALLTWWLSPDIGLVAPAVSLSALTYERDGALRATLDSTIQAGVTLRF